MTIEFKKRITENRLMNPMRDFSLDPVPCEIRTDPLTGNTGRIFDLPYKGEKTDWTETVKKSKELFCPFCEENLKTATPLFPEDLIPEGRVTEGEATVFPNLLPFDTYAAVCVMTRRHYVPIEDWSPEIMRDGFTASLRFLRRVAEKDARASVFYINWNYMPPAGSSLVHPHLQPNSGYAPSNEHRMQIQGASGFRAATGRPFWKAFVETERDKGERYIADIGPSFWAMNFVPLGFLPDVLCVFPGCGSLLDFDDEASSAFLRGLTATIAYFASEYIQGFNVALYSLRDGQDLCVNARISPRLQPRGIGNSDIAYMQMLHNEPFCLRPPETVTEKIRAFFPGS